MNPIIWLASYPKVGNTWLRVFLENFKRDDGRPADINALEVGYNASSRALFDDALGVESSDLSANEIDRYRPAVYRQAAAKPAETLILKAHDAYTLNDMGEPLFPTDVTRGAIYLVRNPLDVAVSFAHHLGKSMDATIALMAQPDFAPDGETNRVKRKVRHKLLTWSEHALSWLEQNEIRVHVMRYEDMLNCPLETFGAAVRFIGWEYEEARVERAVRLSAFENVQAQERARGFKEKPSGMPAFFRKGQAGSWREELNGDQIARIIRDHGEVMQRFGYMEKKGV